MKGPSLDAIRKFKQSQEEKKKLEYDQKVKEKLTTLEHRASRGDKKAKTQLKQIEKVEEERNKPPEPKKNHYTRPSGSAPGRSAANGQSSKSDRGKSSLGNRPKHSEFDFDQLMKLAAGNTNEVKQVEKKPPVPPAKEKRAIPRCQPHGPRVSQERATLAADRPQASNLRHPPNKTNPPSQTKASVSQRVAPQLSVDQQRPIAHARAQPSAANSHDRRPMYRPSHMQQQVRHRLPPRKDYYDEDEYDDDDDYYESDGFVVDDDDDGVRSELTDTLRTLFRYDKRKCDLREQELDRQYRAIGRVNTFEDLEREERRASRLAAAEDAEAMRDLEERKRLKKLRLKELRG